jgi:four helix bundle protein
VRSAFRDFPAYVAAAALANDLFREVARWEHFSRWSLGRQLVRAADSVGANIAEASGRWQPADKKRLLVIARGSLHETEHWLVTADERGLMPDVTERLDPIARGIGGLIQRQRSR